MAYRALEANLYVGAWCRRAWSVFSGIGDFMNKIIKRYGSLLIGLVVLALAWNYFRAKPAPIGSVVIAKPAPELKNAPKQDIMPPKVSVYTPPAKKKLDLPADVQDDPNKYVLGSAKLPADTHPHTVTTVIDAKTGEVRTYDRRDPLPWLAAEQTGEIRIDYGYKTGLVKVARISLREDLLQVKALHAGINVAIDTDGAWFAGAGIGYRW
jgi:hypothetical protein